MDQAEIFNLYVEKLTNSVTELTKVNLLQSAQIAYYEKVNTLLNNKVKELQENLEASLNKVDSKSKKSDNEF
jgi:hypothetical protein